MSPTTDVIEARSMRGRALTPADGLAAPLCAALLGLVLLYAVGFAQPQPKTSRKPTMRKRSFARPM
jgi:hypothetical protein